MREQRGGEKIFVVVSLFPFVTGHVCLAIFNGQRERRRAQAQDISQRRFVIPLPAIRQKAALRSPSVSKGHAAIDRPTPVSAPVKLVRQFPDFTFFLGIAIEISSGREHTGEKKSCVDR